MEPRHDTPEIRPWRPESPVSRRSPEMPNNKLGPECQGRRIAAPGFPRPAGLWRRPAGSEVIRISCRPPPLGGISLDTGWLFQ